MLGDCTHCYRAPDECTCARAKCPVCGELGNCHVDTCAMEPMDRVTHALVTAPPWKPGEPHVFFKWKNGDTFRSCARCGGCEPAKPNGKPCRGPTRILLREFD